MQISQSVQIYKIILGVKITSQKYIITPFRKCVRDSEIRNQNYLSEFDTYFSLYWLLSRNGKRSEHFVLYLGLTIRYYIENSSSPYTVSTVLVTYLGIINTIADPGPA